MKILIIGGSGHVSGALARAAVAAGHTVWSVTRGRRPLPPGVRSLVADRQVPGSMEAVVKEQRMQWDFVADCICYEPAEMRRDLDLFRERADRFLFVSTDFVYDPGKRRVPQSADSSAYVSPSDGSPPYGRKKRLCELELINNGWKLDWTIVRPCHIYGPTSELGCLPLHSRDADLISSLRSGAPVRLVGGGYFLQQPVLAEDLARMMLSTAGNAGASKRIFNAAGPDVIESWRYYQIIADALGVPLKVEELCVRPYLAEHPEHLPFLCHRVYDLQPLREAGLDVPSTPITEGLCMHVEGLLQRRGSAGS